MYQTSYLNIKDLNINDRGETKEKKNTNVLIISNL